jgi:hypothetical protein
VTAAGDFDGDGHRDVLCGAPQHRNGAAFLLYGQVERRVGAALLNTTGVAFLGRDVADTLDGSLSARETGDRSGTSVAGGADLNGDGYDDIVIGAPGLVTGDVHAGSVFVFLGRAR